MAYSSLPQFNLVTPLTEIQDSTNNHFDLFIPPQQTQSPPILDDNMANQSFSSLFLTPETIINNENDAFNTQQSIPHPHEDIYHLKNQGSLRRNKLSIFGDLANHDWEAVMYFLRSQVRCGGDVSKVYKCNFCSHEFPNAQAFGGHMSSHSKTKKSPLKKMKRRRKGVSNFACGKDKNLEMEKVVDKDSMKEREGFEDFVNNETLEEAGEEWFKYLNYDAE